MRELRRIHKGELKEANKLASKILQQMDQLEKSHDNEKQVCHSGYFFTRYFKFKTRKLDPAQLCVYTLGQGLCMKN